MEDPSPVIGTRHVVKPQGNKLERKKIIVKIQHDLTAVKIWAWVFLSFWYLNLVVNEMIEMIEISRKTLILVHASLSHSSAKCPKNGQGSEMETKWPFCIKKWSFLIKISKFLSVKAVIPPTVNKIASSGGFSPLYTSFPLYRSPLNTSFTV